MAGPLLGVRIVEFEGIGPAPYCGMLLADLGAEVVRVTRPAVDRGPLIRQSGADPIDRGRTLIELDLKTEAGIAGALDLIAAADGLVEGLRPGVMERLGLGPDVAMQRNPAVVYCRITGWGQEGPWASTAGHDLNYIALSGALAAMGTPGQPPLPPLNLVGDYGGGGLYAAFGLVSALFAARISGKGQVVDAAMLDGATSQMTMIYGMAAAGEWQSRRGANLLDGGAPFYRCYTCADGRYLSVAAIEPQFFEAMMNGIGLDPKAWDQADRTCWPAMAEAIALRIATRDRDAWAAHFDASDACVAPVLSLAEAPGHPHNAARGTFDGGAPAPGPRFSDTSGAIGPARQGELSDVLAAWRASAAVSP